MSLPFYQRHHQHFDRAYRHKELESTLSQYQKEEKRKSAIYTHGSTAYSHRGAAAYRQDSAFSDQKSTEASQELTEAHAHKSAAHSKRSSAYSLGSELVNKKAEVYHHGSELINKKAEAYRLGYDTYSLGLLKTLAKEGYDETKEPAVCRPALPKTPGILQPTSGGLKGGFHKGQTQRYRYLKGGDRILFGWN